MMRSLWSGVSGLRVHQVGMDVEGNNIANVNTYGFKYSRVNYSTMFSQTMSIATQPTANLGGRNAKQVGLGVEATATQRIHSQGNMQTTDSNYDVAISGNGFFLVSNDGGKTQYLTRDGAFNQDAAGNFVNSSGYVVQGWVRDPITGRIDTSLPAGNLSWDPSMSIPANPSSEIYLNASLNSGSKIDAETSRYIYSLDSVHGINGVNGLNHDENGSRADTFYTTSNNAIDVREKAVDFAAVFNSDTYENLNLRNNQSFWFSYADATFNTNQTAAANGIYDGSQTTPGVYTYWGTTQQPTRLHITLNGQEIDTGAGSITGIDAAMSAINAYSSVTGVEATISNNQLVLRNRNASGTDDNMKNIRLQVAGDNSAGEDHDLTFGVVNNTTVVTAATSQKQANQSRLTNDGANNRDSVEIITAHRYQYSSSAQNIGAMSDPIGGAGNVLNNVTNNGIPAGGDTGNDEYVAALFGQLLNNNARIFHSTEDLRELMQRDARYGVDYTSSGTNVIGTTGMLNNINHNVKVTVNSVGRFVFSNENVTQTIANANITINGTFNGLTINNAQIDIAGNTQNNITSAKDMYFQASSYRNENAQISSNDALTTIFKGLQGTLDAGNLTKQSAAMVLSSYSSALQVYDSLGTKHLIRVEWTKHETTVDGGNLWQMILRIDEPATFNVVGQARNNIIVGEVRFGNDGSLVSYDPTDITFSGNNGSAPNQLISLNLGAVGGFNGLVSNDQKSGISQQETDGYPPGTMLQGMQNKSIDQEGNIIAAFDNGIQMNVGKIAMGNVTNEVGLEEIGSNLFRTTANSGSLTVGTSNTGGRGTFKSATLEMSNADLSLALTNLIVIQRGYQANSKTITTSDTMLNTLLQLKQ